MFAIVRSVSLSVCLTYNKALNYFRKRSTITDDRMGSKYASNDHTRTWAISIIHGFRDVAPVRKLHAHCCDVQNFWAKQAVLMVAFKLKAVFNRSKSQ